jgi:hypothetical protein
MTQDVPEVFEGIVVIWGRATVTKKRLFLELFPPTFQTFSMAKPQILLVLPATGHAAPGASILVFLGINHTLSQNTPQLKL